mmetsp:Transcript_42838/g.79857  ORF Transcript_42838/g.79857 Transcript_42838/m.79857 type:complete len:364 (+) Transcript_42838:43-1134(+)
MPPSCLRRDRFLPLWLLLLFGTSLGAGEKPVGTPLNFKLSEPTEEESKSFSIPREFRCSACRAVIYQLEQRMDKLKLKDPASLDKSARREQAIRVAEALEEVCDDNTYKDYGIKELAEGGGKVLAGPGIESDAAGVTQGGGKWPARIGARCRSMVEDEDVGAAPEGSLERLCDKDCMVVKDAGAASSKEKTKKKKSDPTETESSKKKQSAKKQVSKTKQVAEMEDVPPPSNNVKVVTAENISEIIAPGAYYKFVLVLFFDATKRSSHAVTILEYAASLLKKEKNKAVRKTVLARYDSSEGDTWGYKFAGPLPRALLYRKGYRNPKKFDGNLDGPQDLVDWLRQQSAFYMKDDPEAFPRAGQEL